MIMDAVVRLLGKAAVYAGDPVPDMTGVRAEAIKSAPDPTFNYLMIDNSARKRGKFKKRNRGRKHA